jgi:hypothetical protein
LAWPLADGVTDEALETRLFGRAGVAQARRGRVTETLDRDHALALRVGLALGFSRKHGTPSAQRAKAARIEFIAEKGEGPARD